MKVFIASSWSNKSEVARLGAELKRRGHQVYSFLESGANLLTGLPIEEEMRAYHEALGNWKKDARIAQIYHSETEAIRSSDMFVLLLPAGDSSHFEAGFAFGLGKKTALIGQITKPEIVDLAFDDIYSSVDDFLFHLN